MTPLLIPPRLALGDTIGLVAPASPTEKPERVDEVIAHLKKEGFAVKTGTNLRRRIGYLAGTDAERAADLHAMFADPEVKAVFALRGGYGSCRLLPLLDYALIRANPKPFLGYSDITALHHALLVKAGLVTYHGPNANEAFQPGNNAALRRALMEPVQETDIFSRVKKGGEDIVCEVPGAVKGPLLGGNMTCLLRLLGTPYAPNFDGAILFLEDIGEKAYRVDGMFAHLRLAGVLDRISGLGPRPFRPLRSGGTKANRCALKRGSQAASASPASVTHPSAIFPPRPSCLSACRPNFIPKRSG